MKSLLALTTILSLSAGLVAQTQTHVWIDAMRGNDNNAGTKANPFKTLTKGLLANPTNAVVHVMPGIYGPKTTGDFWDATAKKSKVIQLNNHVNYRIVGENRALCILDFNGMNDQFWAFLQIRGSGTKGVEVSNLTFRNIGTGGQWACGPLHVHGGNDQDVNIHSNIFIDTNSTFICWSGTNVAFHDNLILSTTRGKGVAVRVRTNGKSGDLTYVYNNVFYNTAHGISYSKSAKQWICNNIVLKATIGFPGTKPPASVTLKNNIAFQCATNFAYTPDSSNLTVDPKLVDPAKGDFRQKPGSPCFEGGYRFGLLHMVNDFFGNARASDGDGNGTARPDIGIQELVDVTMDVIRFGQGKRAIFTLRKTTSYIGPAAFFFAWGKGSLVLDPFGSFGLDLGKILFVAPTSIPGAVTLPLPVSTSLNGFPLYAQAAGVRPGPRFKPTGRLDLHL